LKLLLPALTLKRAKTLSLALDANTTMPLKKENTVTQSADLNGNLNGKWTGLLSLPDGELPVTFVFKADGTPSLIGTMESQAGVVTVDGGNIDGITPRSIAP
jgi:hypothetical protein